MKSIKNKIVLIFSLVIVLAVLSTSFAGYRVSSKTITKESLDKCKTNTDNSAEKINNWFNYQVNSIEDIVHNVNFVDNYDYDYLCNYLASKQKVNEDVLHFYVGQPNNGLISSIRWKPTPDFIPTERDWYKEAIKSKEPVILKPYIDANTGDMVFTIANKIEKAGKLKGVAASDVKANIVTDMVLDSNPMKNSYAFLIDNDGSILVHPKEEFQPEGEDFKSLNNILDGRLEKVVNSKNSIELEKDFDGKDKYFITSPIKSTGWKICVVVPKSEVEAPLKQIVNRTLITLVIAIIISIIVSLLVSASISTPIVAATKHSEKIANLNIKDDVSKKYLERKDEIGQMFTAFQSIIDNLRQLAILTADNSEKVAAAAEELSATSEQSTSAAESIAETSTHVAENSDSQLKEVLNIVSSMQQISASIQEVASNAEEISSLTDKTFKHSNIGKEKIEKTTIQMNNIAGSTKEIQNSLNDINDSSIKINEFVDVIHDIAEQTNLLALNAAIEAARAGEHGKGFAVVAEEVRKLAEGVQDAAEKISNLIVENNKVLENTNSVVENNTMNVDEGIKSINDTSETFVEITELVERVSQQIEVITHSIEEVAKGSEDIVASTSEMENMSKTVSGEIQNVSAATEEQTASMEEISSACQSLAEIAEELSTLIQRVEY